MSEITSKLHEQIEEYASAHALTVAQDFTGSTRMQQAARLQCLKAWNALAITVLEIDALLANKATND